MNSNNNFFKLHSDESEEDVKLLKEFLTGCENQNRLSISVISALCCELREIDENDEDITTTLHRVSDRIIRQCSQIMKMTEIYSVLSDSLNERAVVRKNVDLSEYLYDFSEECNEKLGGFFYVEYEKNVSIYASIIKRLMDFALGMFVRKAALDGAEAVNLSAVENEDYVIISADIINNNSKPYTEKAAESFSDEYAYQIIKVACDRMDTLLTIDEKGIQIKIIRDNSGEIVFSSNEPKLKNHSFSTLSNLLSDLNNG